MGYIKPYLLQYQEFGLPVERAAAVMTASPETLFTVEGGDCMLLVLRAKVAVVIQGQATTFKYQSDPTGAPLPSDLCATVDLNAAAVGSMASINGVPATAALLSRVAYGMMQPLIVQPGIITGVYGAVSTGQLSHFLSYIPLASNARIVAA